MKIKISNWRILLIKLYILANIIDAGGGLKLKYIASALLLILLLGKARIKFNYMECVLFLIYPVILVGYAVAFCGVSIGAAISSVTFCLAIIFSIVLINEKCAIEDIMKFFMKAMSFLAIVTIIIFIGAYVLKMIGLGRFYVNLSVNVLNPFKMGFFGYNYVSGIYMPIVYFRCAMFLILGLAIACHYKSKKDILVIFVANMVVSTTANILFSLIIMLCYIFSNAHTKKFKIFTGFFGSYGILTILILKFGEIYGKFYEYFDDLTMKSDSSMIKVGHITSIIENMFGSVRYFLFGMGGGSSFYSTGRETELVSCEVSQMECWRRFGTIYTTVFFIYIFYVAYKLWKTSRIISIGLVILFVATASNPQLMSPLFLTVLFLCNSWCNEKTKEQRVKSSILAFANK